MLLILLSYLGGVLTILSPCILPVLPFVFARAGAGFTRSALPLLAGMVATFAAVATLAAVGGGWAVHANQYGRYAALLLLAVFGLTLLFPAIADRAMQPLVRLGGRLSNSADAAGGRASIAPSLLLGVATGLLWAPCAGPILGLVLTGAALQGASASTALLLLAYGLGAATSLAAALLIGGRVFAALKRSLGVGEWIRRALGVAVLAGVVAIALGLDTGLLAKLSLAQTAGLEQRLVSRVQGGGEKESAPLDLARLPDEGALPGFAGGGAWLDSPPLTAESLRGKVVLVDFWTYSCINCLRTLPYLRAWAQRYADLGLVVVGVHTPEFAFERDEANVRKAVADLQIGYPVVLDNQFAIWRAFNNQYWPGHYFVDAQGRIRHHHYGEGAYEQSEDVIRQLLKEAGRNVDGLPRAEVQGAGVTQAAMRAEVKSPETYVGYQRAKNFASPGGAQRDVAQDYVAPEALALNQWALAGRWLIGAEKARTAADGARLAFRFHARDLHLVLGSGGAGKPLRFRVTLDSRAPGAAHGVDTDEQGYGHIDGQRLYQLIRQQDAKTIDDRRFEIEFLDAGAEAFAFTFG